MSDDSSLRFNFSLTAEEIRALLRHRDSGHWKTILAAMRIPSAILPSAAWLAAWGYFEPAIVCLALFLIACVLIGVMLWRTSEEFPPSALRERSVIIGPRGVKLLGDNTCTLLHWRLLRETAHQNGLLLLNDEAGRAWAAIPQRALGDQDAPARLARIDAWRQATDNPRTDAWPDVPQIGSDSPESTLPELHPLTASVEFTPTIEDELDALALMYSPPPRQNYARRSLDSLWLLGLALMLAHLFDSEWDWANQGPWKYLGGAPLMLVALLLPQGFLRATEFVDRRHHRFLLGNDAAREPISIRYTVCREGLLTENRHMVSLESWSALSGLQSRERSMVLSSESGAIFFVPWTAFESPQQRAEFEIQLERRVAAGGQDAEAELTSIQRQQLNLHPPESGNPFQPPQIG